MFPELLVGLMKTASHILRTLSSNNLGAMVSWDNVFIAGSELALSFEVKLLSSRVYPLACQCLMLESHLFFLCNFFVYAGYPRKLLAAYEEQSLPVRAVICLAMNTESQWCNFYMVYISVLIYCRQGMTVKIKATVQFWMTCSPYCILP